MPNRCSAPVWRSLLYVPATSERFITSAAERGADAVILDLEDSIPASEKAKARAALPAAVSALKGSGSDIVIRVNASMRLLVNDIEAAILPGVKALCLPKIANAHHLAMICDLIAEIEAEKGMPPGSIGVVALIETVEALTNVFEIAQASPRLLAISLGDEDFCTDAGIEANIDTLLWPKQQIVLAAHRNRILALGHLGTIADYGDLAAYETSLSRSRRFGLDGVPCIHPQQIDIANRVFAPADAEVDFARRVLVASDEALLRGSAAFALGGRMIDGPAVERARALILHPNKISETKAGKFLQSTR